MKLRYGQQNRPGCGWKHLAGSVYEHENGLRVHMHGFALTVDGDHVSANIYPEYIEATKFIRINGGNRKRGLMAWALSLKNNPVAKGTK